MPPRPFALSVCACVRVCVVCGVCGVCVLCVCCVCVVCVWYVCMCMCACPQKSTT